MDKLISQQAAIDALKELTANGTNKGMVFGEDAVHRIEMLPSVQPYTTTHDSIPAETGKNDEDRTSGDCISRQMAIESLTEYGNGRAVYIGVEEAVRRIEQLPSAQPDIIRCKDCKHWKYQFKTANGDGLGSCDFHNVALVTSEGFCYWAEKRGEAVE